MVATYMEFEYMQVLIIIIIIDVVKLRLHCIPCTLHGLIPSVCVHQNIISAGGEREFGAVTALTFNNRKNKINI